MAEQAQGSWGSSERSDVVGAAGSRPWGWADPGIARGWERDGQGRWVVTFGESEDTEAAVPAHGLPDLAAELVALAWRSGAAHDGCSDWEALCEEALRRGGLPFETRQAIANGTLAPLEEAVRHGVRLGFALALCADGPRGHRAGWWRWMETASAELEAMGCSPDDHLASVLRDLERRCAVLRDAAPSTVGATAAPPESRLVPPGDRVGGAGIGGGPLGISRPS